MIYVGLKKNVNDLNIIIPSDICEVNVQYVQSIKTTTNIKNITIVVFIETLL